MMKTLVLTLTICSTSLVAEQQKQSQPTSNLRKISDAIHNLSYTELALILGMAQLPSVLSTHYFNTKYTAQRIIRDFNYPYASSTWSKIKHDLKASTYVNTRWIAVSAAAAFILKKTNDCIRKWTGINEESEEEIV